MQFGELQLTYHFETIGVLSAAQFELVLFLVSAPLEIAFTVEESLEVRHSHVDFVHLAEQLLEDVLTRTRVEETVQVVLCVVIDRDAFANILNGRCWACGATIRRLNFGVARIGSDRRECRLGPSMLQINQRTNDAAVRMTQRTD